MSEDKPKQGKHAEPESPQWPGTKDPGAEFDKWLEESNRKAEGQ